MSANLTDVEVCACQSRDYIFCCSRRCFRIPTKLFRESALEIHALFKKPITECYKHVLCMQLDQQYNHFVFTTSVSVKFCNDQVFSSYEVSLSECIFISKEMNYVYETISVFYLDRGVTTNFIVHKSWIIIYKIRGAAYDTRGGVKLFII